MVVPQAFPHKKKEAAAMDTSSAVDATERDTQQQEILQAFISRREQSRRIRKPLDMPRKRTDSFYLYVFAIFLVAWIIVVTDVLNYGQKSSQRSLDYTEAAKFGFRVESKNVELNDWYSFLDFMIGSAIDGAACHFKKIWPVMIAAFCIVPLIPFVMSLRLLSKGLYALMVITNLCSVLAISLLSLIKIKEWRHSSECLSVAEKAYLKDEMMILIAASTMILGSQLFYGVVTNDEYSSRVTGILLGKVRHYRTFMLLVVASIVCSNALAYWAIQYTSATEASRYFIFVGNLLILDFVLNFENMVVAQIVATHLRSNNDKEQLHSAASAFAYANCVFNYHLGSIALLTFNLTPTLQSFVAVCKFRRDVVEPAELQPKRSRFSEFFYGIYLIFNASAYAQSYVAVNGCSFNEATSRSVNLLMTYCSSSSVAFLRGMNSILRLQLIVFFVLWVLAPMYNIGFSPIIEKFGTNYAAIWTTIGILSTVAVIYVVAVDTSFNIVQTSRLCLLEDRVYGKPIVDIDIDAAEYCLCFDGFMADDGFYALKKDRDQRKSNCGCELLEVKLIDPPL